jgi:hypothetical protein
MYLWLNVQLLSVLCVAHIFVCEPGSEHVISIRCVLRQKPDSNMTACENKRRKKSLKIVILEYIVVGLQHE